MLLATRALAEKRAPAAFMAVVNQHLLSIAERADRVLVASVQEIINQLAHVLPLVL